MYWCITSKTMYLYNYTELAIFALGQVHCSTPILVPKLGFVKILPPKFSATCVLRTMITHTLPMYFHSIGGQQNHIHDIVFFELSREPQQNILFHIYISIYIRMIICGTKH
jgi:hypothetical protein